MFEVKGWVSLAAGEDARLRGGHLWVFSNEIAHAGGDFAEGDLVWVQDASSRKIGTGFVNRASKIGVRLLTRGAAVPFSDEIFRARLAAAIARRAHLKHDAVRLVNAEGDLLPGLVVDSYAGALVVQTQTLGWELRRDFVVAELVAALGPKAVVLKNDSLSREAEGLERYATVVSGRLGNGAASGGLVIREQGLDLGVDVLGGQKTGFYIDQRENRKLVLPMVQGRSVLDCFSYTGAWSVMCARAGASEVVGLDASEAAVAMAKENARRNGVEAATTFRVADVFDELPRLAAAKAKFDVVILDPPSLAKTRRALAGAVRGYIHLNKVALGLLKPGGLLATCSCSHHISRDGFRETLRTAASLARKQAAVIGAGGQPEDHPSLLGVPESDYLKCFLLAVI
jgi:23S rRNA (cytosine1962-C5)-methyltransferase